MDEEFRGSSEPGSALASRGILLPQGGQLIIPAGALSIGFAEDGSLTGEVKEVLLWTDMVTPWLSISLDHLVSAQNAKRRVLSAVAAGDNERLAQALREEVAASMQGMVAAATAMEAFYAGVRDRSDLPRELLAKWRNERRNRPRQVGEVLRRAVRLPNGGTRNLRVMLTNLFKFRGWAVHPPNQAQRPVFREDIGYGVEWRYQAFQYTNAQPLVRAVFAIVAQIAARSEKAGEEDLKVFLAARNESLKPLLGRWEELFGPLLEQAGS